MINTSAEYKQVVEGNNRNWVISLNFTFTDGATLELTDKTQLMSPGLTYDAGTSSPSSFDIGSAIISKLDISLNNKEGAFDAYTWVNASVVLKVGLVLSETTETLLIGTFYVDKAVNGGVTKVLKCLGPLALLDKDYSVSRAYPATVYQAYYDACTTCGVVPQEANITCGELEVSEKPSGVTCREVSGYAAMLSGGVVAETPDGGICIKHYGTEVVKTITKLNSRSIEDNDITITGIQVNYGDEIYQSGAAGYMLSIADNPLITSAESATEAATAALANLLTPFRPLSIKCPLDPSLQPGDRIAVVSKGETFYTYATGIKWSLNGSMTITCGAKTERDQESDRYSAISKTLITNIAKDVSNQAISSYDFMATQLNALLTNAMGYHETVEVQEDGSQIKYAHDGPTLAESTIVYKQTVDGFGYSTDGGQTYTSGWTAEGNILAKVLTAIGINADWIRTGDLVVGGASANADGAIKVYDADNNVICTIDKTGFMAILGTIAGWQLLEDEMRSTDGTVRLNSLKNALEFYLHSGDEYTLQTRLNNNGLYNYDSNGTLRNALTNTSNIFYDSTGDLRININSDGFNQYSLDGNLLGHIGRSTVYAVDGEGNITSTVIGEMIAETVEDESLGWAIFAVVPGSEITAKQRRVFYSYTNAQGYEKDHFYLNCESTFIRHTETDPYYVKKISFDDANNKFTITAGVATGQVADVTNTFSVTEDASGRVTAITNETTGRVMEIEYS